METEEAATDMKTLILVRHAKSSAGDPSMPDKARRLNARGEADAPMMGRRLASRGIKPDLIVSSPAVRARMTAALIAAELDYEPAGLVVNDSMYASEADRLLDVIHRLDDGLACVMLIGHNPEFTELAQRFSDEITRMPTCAVAELTFETSSWAFVGQAEPVAVGFDSPRNSPDETS